VVRVMIFVDHLNFEIATSNYYAKYFGARGPKLDYNSFPKELAKLIPDSRLVRTYIFAPKPDDFLMQDPTLKSYYDWINGTLRNIRYLQVIDGEYIARPTDERKPMNINDHTTYYKVEKGTDVNLATCMLAAAYQNAYDVAILVSADSDYIPIIRQVSNFGKNVVAVGVYGQNLTKLKRETDDIFILKKEFFDNCLR